MKTLILLITFSITAVSSIAQDPVGFVVFNTGDTTFMYPSPLSTTYMSTIQGNISFWEKDARKQTHVSAKKVKKVQFGDNRVMLALPLVRPSMMRFQEVIAVNDEYMLTNHANSSFCIFKRDSMEPVVKSKDIGYKEKKDLKTLNEFIEPYFSSCPKLIEALRKSIVDSCADKKASPRMFMYVYNYSCELD